MRKHIIFSIIMVLGVYWGYAQSDYSLNIKVYDKKGLPQSDVKVWVKEAYSGEVITKNSNAEGVASFKLTEGTWHVSLIGLPNYKEITVEKNIRGHGNFSLTYNMEETVKHNAIKDARKTMQFEEVPQTSLNPQQGNGFARVNIKVKNTTNKYLPGIEVKLVSTKQGKIYTAKTNHAGQAAFLLPIDDFYSVDVNEVQDISHTGDINKEGIFTVTVTYEPTVITEEIKNDTIRQKITYLTKPSSSRTLYKLNISRPDGSPADGEYVFLNQIHTNFVYMGETDKNGEVKFLLPNKYRYLIHFEFLRDFDVISLMNAQGNGNGEANIVYTPDPKLEHPEQYIPRPDNYFLISYEEFVEKQLPEPTENLVDMYADWGSGTVNANSKEAVLQVAFAVGSKVPNVKKEKRPPLNIVFVIDKSGSMAGYDRIESLKESMLEYSKTLDPEDNIAIITFNTEPFTEMTMQKAGNGDYFREQVNLIEPGGGTNIYNGLVLGFDLLMKTFDGNRSNILVLLTDGYGTTEPKIIVAKSKEYTSKGLDLITVGVGQCYNAALLNLLSEECGAPLNHVGGSEELHYLFANELSSVVAPMAYDATMEVYYNDMVQLQSLYGYPIASNKNSIAKVEIGDLYAGYQKFTLLHFKLDHPTQAIESKPITMVLSYTVTATGERIQVKQDAYLKWEPYTGKYEIIVDNHMKRLYAIAILNQSIKVMLDAYYVKDYDLVYTTYDRAIVQIKELFPDAMENEIQDLVENMNQYVEAIHQAQKNNSH